VPLLLLAVLSGCAGLKGPTKSESALLPKPGARVHLASVTNASGAPFELDAVAMLREAMLVALPFWGSTLLVVRGTLRDPGTSELAGDIDHAKAVVMGGIFTIGAWSRIFTTMAEDLADDLKTRIEKGGDFTVYPTPRDEQTPAPPPPGDAVRIKIAGIADQRPDKTRIGIREAAFGAPMGDVYLGRNPAAFVREALADDLLAAGYRLVDSDPDVTVHATLRRLWLRTETTPLYWDLVGDIELELTIEGASASPAQALYSCRHSDRTWVWPSATLMGRVDACVAELMLKARSDDVWTRMAGRRPR
jgi:hypothetical protein